MPLESAIFFETPEEICARVFRDLLPRAAMPRIQVEFCPSANTSSRIRREQGALHLRISDVLKDAPAPVLEALAGMLIARLYRKPVPRAWSHRYRLYLNRRDVRHTVERVGRERGRKYLSGTQGETWDLIEVFEDINLRYFHGLMARPDLSWSRLASRTRLGHYDPVHHTIVLSKLLDRPGTPRLVVEYVMFHEMLHLRHPVEHKGARRRVHTRGFREAEKQFEHLAEAKALLRQL